jgi:hypothetical protein
MFSSTSKLAPTGSVAYTYLDDNVYTVNKAQRWAEFFIVVETV